MRKYSNVKGRFIEFDIEVKDVAKELGISKTSLYAKLNGKVDWRLDECQGIVNMLNERANGAFTLDSLFG